MSQPVLLRECIPTVYYSREDLLQLARERQQEAIQYLQKARRWHGYEHSCKGRVIANLTRRAVELQQQAANYQRAAEEIGDGQ